MRLVFVYMINISVVNEDICNEIDADIDNLLIHPTTLRYLKEHNVSVNDFKQYYFDELPISFENMDEIVDAFGAIHFTIGIHNVIEIQKRILNVPAYLYKFEYEMNNSLAKKIMGPHIKGKILFSIVFNFIKIYITYFKNLYIIFYDRNVSWRRIELFISLKISCRNI